MKIGSSLRGFSTPRSRVYSVPGSYSFIPEAGVTSVTITVVGAGGGGGQARLYTSGVNTNLVGLEVEGGDGASSKFGDRVALGGKGVKASGVTSGVATGDVFGGDSTGGAAGGAGGGAGGSVGRAAPQTFTAASGQEGVGHGGSPATITYETAGVTNTRYPAGGGGGSFGAGGTGGVDGLVATQGASGGGGGGYATRSVGYDGPHYNPAGGGGGGQVLLKESYTVTPGTPVSVVVGAGGASGPKAGEGGDGLVIVNWQV